MIDLIKHIFEEVYGRYSNNISFELNLENETNNKILTTFVDEFTKKYNGSIDEDIILNYIILQFRYYENAKTRFGKGKVYLNWIFGRKALLRWDIKPSNWLFWNQRFIRKYNIQITEYEQKQIDKKAIEFINSLERKRFFNTHRGVIHCSELGLFDAESDECKLCDFKIFCLNL